MLVVAPTRELALQSAAVASAAAEGVGVRVTCLYGGVPKSGQKDEIRRGVAVVLATPGEACSSPLHRRPLCSCQAEGHLWTALFSPLTPCRSFSLPSTYAHLPPSPSGRLRDLVEEGSVDLSEVNYVVLDGEPSTCLGTPPPRLRERNKRIFQRLSQCVPSEEVHS